MLYPIAAGICIARTPAPVSAIAGYALANLGNLGYVLFAAGVFKGTFLIFGLGKRGQVLALGAVFLVIGIVLSSVRT